MPDCEIITVGSELLDGTVLNTNARFLAREISALHFEVIRQTACRDREDEIRECLSQAYGRAAVIFVTGGLGPTPDDVTREAVARHFQCGLKFDPKQFKRVANYFRNLGKRIPSVTRSESFFPSAAKPILNPFGIALGFYMYRDRRLVVVLPGVPRELEGLFQSKVRGLLERYFPERDALRVLTARVAQLNEPEIMRRLGKSFFELGKFGFGIYPDVGVTTIRLKTREKILISRLKKELSSRLKGCLFSFEEESLSQAVGKLLRRRKETVAVAESCTGGLLSKRLTDEAGASRYFVGGTIAYSNDVKIRELGVPQTILKSHGAVSEEAALAMSKAAREKFLSTYGLSVTGIAGPEGGSRRKPVGLVYIGLSKKGKTRVIRCRFGGDRRRIRGAAVSRSLFLLWQWLKS